MRTLSGLLLVSFAVLAGTAQAADSDKLLPSDTTGVITINVRQLLDSALFKKLDDKLSIRDALKKNAELKQVLDAINLDPTKDLDKVVLAATGGGKQDEALVLMLGKFDRAKIEKAASDAAKDDKNKLKIIKEGNYSLYEMVNKDGQTIFGAVVNETTLALAPRKDFVVDVLDRNAGKKTTTLKKDVAELIAKADTKQSISVVGLTSGLAGQAADFADKIKTVTGGINVTDEVKVNFDLTAKNDDGAKEIAKQIDENIVNAKQLVGILAAQQKQWAPLIDVLGTVKIETKGSNIGLKGEVSKDIIDKLIKLIPAQQ